MNDNFIQEMYSAVLERQMKRLTIAIVISVILLFLSNAMWLYAWCQYDYSDTDITYQQDSKGVNIIGDLNHVTKVDHKNKDED